MVVKTVSFGALNMDSRAQRTITRYDHYVTTVGQLVPYLYGSTTSAPAVLPRYFNVVRLDLRYHYQHAVYI